MVCAGERPTESQSAVMMTPLQTIRRQLGSAGEGPGRRRRLCGLTLQSHQAAMSPSPINWHVSSYPGRAVHFSNRFRFCLIFPDTYRRAVSVLEPPQMDVGVSCLAPYRYASFLRMGYVEPFAWRLDTVQFIDHGEIFGRELAASKGAEVLQASIAVEVRPGQVEYVKCAAGKDGKFGMG